MEWLNNYKGKTKISLDSFEQIIDIFEKCNKEEPVLVTYD